jgi:ferri-bacillibactin esterase
VTDESDNTRVGIDRKVLTRLQSLVPQEATLRSFFFSVEPTRTMQIPGFEWEHEVRVALPISYEHTDRPYPVLWLTDNHIEAALAILGPLDLILVGIGSGLVSMTEWDRRRIYEFSPDGPIYFDGPAGEWLEREQAKIFPDATDLQVGGAPAFLDFLVDTVRPALAAEYRMDDNEHGLFGFSSGGLFVGFSLFARPGAFSRYICGSPPFYVRNHEIFKMEERYAAEHDDLDAHVFFGAGEQEAVEDRIAAIGCLSSMIRLAETLSFRGYPSLRMTVRVFERESHTTMLAPLLKWGVRTVWGDEIAPKA